MITSQERSCVLSAKDVITYSSIISCPMNAVRVYLVPWMWWQCILSQRVWWQCTLSQQSDDNVSYPMSVVIAYISCPMIVVTVYCPHECVLSYVTVLSHKCGEGVPCPMSVVTATTDKQGSGACIPNPSGFCPTLSQDAFLFNKLWQRIGWSCPHACGVYFVSCSSQVVVVFEFFCCIWHSVLFPGNQDRLD